MILTCPECGTQYVVKDGAVPEGGRQVRCAACKHSWHQDPEAAAVETLELEEDERVEEQAGEPASEAPAGYTAIDPIAETVPAAVDEIGGYDETPLPQDDEFSPFAERGELGEERRSPLRGVLIAVAVLALLGVLFWFVAPTEWKARVGLAEGPATPLQLMMTHSDRQRLASGNELLEITGRVINPTQVSQIVPPIQAQLRSRTGELVYSWTIRPPAPTLAPGASATFNSAEVNVPAGGDELTISLGSPKA